MFELHFRPYAVKALEKIGRKDQLKINKSLDVLRQGRIHSLDIQKIQGTKFGYRLRIGRWRILFSLFPRQKRIEIVDVFLKKGKKDYFKKRKLL